MEITRVQVIPSKDYDGDLTALPTFDNTKLVAINTCPLWGIVRYTHHKSMGGMGRAMALEAGGAAHEVFAAHRLYSFREYGASFYSCEQERIENAFNVAGERIFGRDRFQEMLGAVDSREDFRTRCQQFSLTALYNCGFYDDPGDKKRTVTNIEEMCVAYMDKYDWKSKLPYWDGDEFLGIEIPVDVVIKIDYTDPNAKFSHEVPQVIYIRFIGKADAIHWIDREMSMLRVHENKTASRLGDAWEMSWETNHQPTGYMIAIATIIGKEVVGAEMFGTCLPLPRAYTINGLSRVVVKRKMWQLEEWFSWLLHTVLLHEEYKDNATNAPMYTHSCNRYFRPCSFIPLCATEPDERVEMFNDMAVQEWNPLHIQGEVSDE